MLQQYLPVRDSPAFASGSRREDSKQRQRAAASVRGFAAQGAPNEPFGSGQAPGGDVLHVLQVQARSNRPFLTAVPRRSLCAETGLTLRDLRVVDPSFRVQRPAVLVRRNAIVVNLEHVKCIITADTVLVFDYNAPAVKAFMPDLQRALNQPAMEAIPASGMSSSSAGWLGPADTPFEFRALSAALESIAARLSLRSRALAPEVQSLVAGLHAIGGDGTSDAGNGGGGGVSVSSQGLGRDIPLRLVGLNTELARLEADVSGVRDTLSALLSSDEDISGLYLTQRRSEEEHTEAELLLEGFARTVEEVSGEVDALNDTLRITESYVRTALDASRNALLRLDTLLTMGTLAVASGGCILAAFGMNLHTGLEEDTRVFGAACVAAGAMSGATFAALWASAWNTLRSM
jgi:magnesium transporter